MSRERVTIIGGGPAGYTAAIRASQLGASVILIEKDKIGGTCVNHGCIPTKSLIASANLYKAVCNAREFGLSVSGAHVNADGIMERKRLMVEETRGSISRLLKAHQITVLKGRATLQSAHEITVLLTEGEASFKADHLILATGSKSTSPSFLDHTQPCVLSTDQALELTELPQRLLVLGGGVVGVEFACIFGGLGCDVTIIELEDQLIPGEDGRMASFLLQCLTERGIDVRLECRLERVESYEDHRISVMTADGEILTAEKLVVCTGRVPHTSGLGLDRIGLATSPSGGIETDGAMRTSVPDVYAVGDVTGNSMLAHVAAAQGIAAVERALGASEVADLSAIPRCVYSDPEIASVGLSQREATARGKRVVVGKALFSSNGKAIVTGINKGLAQIVVEKETRRLLGAQIIGPCATELISELTVALRNGLSAEDVGETIHPHPTLGEIVQEAARDAYNKSLYKIVW